MIENSNFVLPEMSLNIKGLDGYETFAIDGNTIGVRPKWIKCSDRLPKHQQDIIFFVKDRERSFAGVFVASNKNPFHESLDGWNFIDEEIIYWMPLPELPKE